MCLTYNKKKTEALRKSKKKFVIGYKAVHWDEYSGEMVSIHNPHTWKPGVNKAAHKNAGEPKNRDAIYNGIHVFEHEKSARDVGSDCVIKVKCFLKDLIGAGEDNTSGPSSMVFSQVTLEKSEYDIATRTFDDDVKVGQKFKIKGERATFMRVDNHDYDEIQFVCLDGKDAGKLIDHCDHFDSNNDHVGKITLVK